MGRVVLTCFHRLGSMRGNPPSSLPDFDESLRLLLIDIQELEASLTDHPQSLQWCSGAVNLLKKMHLHLLTFVETCKLSSAEPFDGSREVDCLLDDYMKESLNLLDFCNLLKSVISGMNRYRLLIDFAAERLGKDPSLTESTMVEIQKLEAETLKQLEGINQNMKLGFERWMCNADPRSRKRSSAVGFICAVKGSIRVICMIIFCTIINPVSMENEINRELFVEFPQLNVLSTSLNKLVLCFCKGLEDRSVQVSVEERMVERAIREIKEGASTGDKIVMQGVDLLRKKAAQLNRGLEMFQGEVSELFEDIVKGRNQLLGRVKATYWK